MTVASDAAVALWVFLAFAVERLVELIVKAVPYLSGKKLLTIDAPLVISFIISLVTAVGSNLNFFELFQVSFRWPYVGYFFAALIMTGGSSLVHDLVEWVKASKEIRKLRVLGMK